MKKILCFVLSILCLLAVAGCGGGAKKAEVPAQKQAAAEKVLRVGTDADYPPFEYYQESTKAFIGFDVELVRIQQSAAVPEGWTGRCGNFLHEYYRGAQKGS